MKPPTSNRRAFLKTTTLALAAAPLFGGGKQYKACVIGHTGRGNYGHGLDLAFQKIPNVSVVAVADADEKGRAAAAKRLGVSKTYADFAEMLATEKPQLVTIGPRWVEKRVEMVLAAAAVGASIYMEKPLATSLEDADTIVDAIEKAGTKLTLAHHMRVSPAVVHLKKLIDGGLIGDLMELRARGKEDARVGGEDLAVLGWHCMYLMRYFAGDAQWCSARVMSKGRDITRADARAGTEVLGAIAGDNISATYAFNNGVAGYFASQKTRAKNADFHLALYGSKGAAIIHIGAEPQCFYLPDATWSPGKSKAEWKPLPDAPSHADPTGLGGQPADNKRLVEDLIGALENKREPVASAREGRAVLEMIHAVYTSALSGGHATFPLKDRKNPIGSV